MTRSVVLCAVLLATAGCGSAGLRELARTEQTYFVELQRALPGVIDVHELALETMLTKAQQAEDAAAAAEQAQALKGVIDNAIGSANLNLTAPTWEGFHGALTRLMKYEEDQLALTDAALAARDAKAAAILAAFGKLSLAVPALVDHQNVLVNYLEHERRLLPIGGVSITERPRGIGDLVDRLKQIGGTLDTQFDRARQIFETAKKAAAGGGGR